MTTVEMLAKNSDNLKNLEGGKLSDEQLAILHAAKTPNDFLTFYRMLANSDGKPLSQTQFAGILQCSPPYISQIENGIRPISKDVAIKFYRLSGVPLEYLLAV